MPGGFAPLARAVHAAPFRAACAAFCHGSPQSAPPPVGGSRAGAPQASLLSDHKMFNKVSKSFQYGPHTVVLETGEIARQASGAVLVSVDDTVVLATVVASKTAKPGQDFFPLTVDYVEKTYAAGKIPGGFFKREGKPSEKEILTSRLID